MSDQPIGVPAPLERQRVVAAFEEIAALLELDGGNPFEVRAYQNAAHALANVDTDLASLVAEKKLDTIPGLGKTLIARINEMASTGKMKVLDDLREKVPAGVIQMSRVPGLGAKRIRQLHDALGLNGVDDLRKAAETGKIAGVPGFGVKMQEKILAGIAFMEQHQDRYRLDLAEKYAAGIVDALRDMPGLLRLAVAGSLRRRRETIGDVDVVGGVSSLGVAEAIMQRFVKLPQVTAVTDLGDTKSSVVIDPGLKVDLRLVLDEVFPHLLQHFSGSRDHNITLRGLAQQHGLKVNEYGLWRGEVAIPCADEAAIYAALGMDYIEPEMRENMGEIEAALRHELPHLIEASDLKGILHAHSTWSDGKATIRQMADAARQMGMTYLGMSDHSKLAAYAGGMSAEAVRRQQEEIDALNAEYAGDFRVLKGVECDILKDGALDYDDETLATFDFVIASIHSNFNLPPDEQTARLIRAMEHPACSILGHPTGRILLEREGYSPDMEAVIERAGQLGVAIEINADPHRLDLDWRLVRRARDRGIKIPLCPDAHVPASLGLVRYGVSMARKGWLRAADVLNTLTADELLAFFQAQRARKQ
jgi:DNA polymerase (family X)